MQYDKLVFYWDGHAGGDSEKEVVAWVLLTSKRSL